MVKSATSLTRSGLRDWIIQRISSVIIALYIFFLVGYMIAHPHFSYEVWYQLFCNPIMKVFTILTLISIIAHAYIGLWTIATDYLTASVVVRMVFLTIVWLALFIFLVWGILILSGI